MNILFSLGISLFSIQLGFSQTRFLELKKLQYPKELIPTVGAAFGDVDGDGDIDVLFSAYPSCGGIIKANARLFLNNGNGIFSDATKNLPNCLCPPDFFKVKLIHVDGDKNLDLVSLVQFPLLSFKRIRSPPVFQQRQGGFYMDAKKTIP
jgi:hypothetical protein